MFGKTHFLLTTTFMLGEALLVFQQQPSPGQNIPVNQTPAAQAPGGQTPGVQTPGAQTPGVQTPGAQLPNAVGNTINQPEANRTYGGIGATPWFANPRVRQHLSLPDDQLNQLNQQHQQLYGQYQQHLNTLNQNRLAPDQLRARRNDLDRRFYHDFSTASQQILRDEKARTRFQQLSGQYRGYGALSDPELQQRLNLTDDQRQKIDQLQNYWNGRMNRLNDGFRRDGERSSTEYNHLQQGLRKQLNDVLNDQQRQEWLQVIGDPFDFPAESYFDGEESSPSNRTRNNNRETDAERKN